MTSSFAERLAGAISATGSLLCLGLDPAGPPDAAAAERHCLEMLDQALDRACAVKPNLAFFERLGSAGWELLERLRQRVPDDRVLILDAKRSDIGSSASAYADALFDGLGADAVTVNPLMGEDAVAPFVSRRGRGAFVLTRTSNPGAADLLELRLAGGEPVYERIVRLAAEWDPGGAVGLVVGATAPEAVARVRELAPRLPLLIPGVGAQGGELEASVRAGLDDQGGGLLISLSRGISAAPEGPAAAAAAWQRRIEAARRAVAPAG